MPWMLLIGAIIAEVAATLSLKGSETIPALYAVVAIGYLAAFACLSGALRRGMRIGVAYGVWSAAGVALTAALSAVVFGEAFTVLMGVGVVCIMIGVLLVESGAPARVTDEAGKV
ncbi:DMT family transporter [Gordonia aurantiaca]|uniref:DMT family transporter n=1 Tax=Gordonia sp. B21 TaxID=3151852 RepID=UPI0032658A4B